MSYGVRSAGALVFPPYYYHASAAVRHSRPSDVCPDSRRAVIQLPVNDINIPDEHHHHHHHHQQQQQQQQRGQVSGDSVQVGREIFLCFQLPSVSEKSQSLKFLSNPQKVCCSFFVCLLKQNRLHLVWACYVAVLLLWFARVLFGVYSLCF